MLKKYQASLLRNGCKKDPIDERDYQFSSLLKTNEDKLQITVPKKVDWIPQMSPVKYQMSLGSCVAFAVCALKEWQERVEQEREVIFQIHLSKRKRNPNDFPIEDLVKATHGFTGSEIEKMVKVGLAMAWQKKEKLGPEHLFAAQKEMRPISKIMADKIETSRQWAKGRARPASTYTEVEKDKVKGLVDLSTDINLADLTGDTLGSGGQN